MKKIILPARGGDDLNWDSLVASVENESDLFWQIDLGLENGRLNLKDPALFSSCALALEQFSCKVWPPLKERTRGVSLYCGVWDIPGRLVWDESMEVHFSERLEDAGFTSLDGKTVEIQRALFCADLFAQLMHRLLSLLPEESEVACTFEVSLFNDSPLLAALFSRARFEHLRLLLEGTELPFHAREAPVGLLIPTDQKMTSEILEKLERLMIHLQEQKILFRFIPELLLGEEWDGLERLALIPEALTLPGQRLLRGFEIAGGTLLI